jgi:hypothetical protein
MISAKSGEKLAAGKKLLQHTYLFMETALQRYLPQNCSKKCGVNSLFLKYLRILCEEHSKKGMPLFGNFVKIFQ